MGPGQRELRDSWRDPVLKQRQTSLCLAHNGPVLHNNSPFRELGGGGIQTMAEATPTTGPKEGSWGGIGGD